MINVSSPSAAATFEVGDRVSGTITLDDATIGVPGRNVGTDYDITSIMLALPSRGSQTIDTVTGASIFNDCTTGCLNPGLPARDLFGIGAFSEDLPGASRPAIRISFFWSSEDTSVFADESLAGLIAFFDAGLLPAGPLTGVIRTAGDETTGLDLFGDNCGAFGSRCEYGFQIDTVGVAPPTIPLPAAGWLLLAGLGGLAAYGRGRARR